MAAEYVLGSESPPRFGVPILTEERFFEKDFRLRLRFQKDADFLLLELRNRFGGINLIITVGYYIYFITSHCDYEVSIPYFAWLHSTFLALGNGSPISS